MKKTKIIATMWPAINSESKIISLYKAWVNVIRFNFSHAKYEDVLKTMEIINRLNNQWITKLSFLLDTKWPEIRTWDLESKISYKKWDVFKIYIDKKKRDWNNLFCDYKYIINDSKKGNIIKIDSWLFDCKVTEINKNHLLVKALNDAEIWSRRHINLPWIKLKLPWVTKKDKEDIIFWINNNISFIAASFIRNKENLKDIRQLLKKHNAENIKIISKIENEEWLDNLKEIVEASDWVMVARWDLWIEVPIEKLPVYQKTIVKSCFNHWKFSIIATQLLETMMESSFPTRAETSDVFNSVFQWADCLMLSWETAIWKYPVKVVEIMSSIIKEAEAIKTYKHNDFSTKWLRIEDIEKKILIKSCIYIWEELNAKAIIIFTKTWLLAKLTSSFRPNIPVIAFTNSRESVYSMNSLFGIDPIKLDWYDKKNYEKTLEIAINYLKINKLVSKKDTIVTIYDIKKNNNDISTIKIINIKDW